MSRGLEPKFTGVDPVIKYGITVITLLLTGINSVITQFQSSFLSSTTTTAATATILLLAMNTTTAPNTPSKASVMENCHLYELCFRYLLENKVQLEAKYTEMYKYAKELVPMLLSYSHMFPPEEEQEMVAVFSYEMQERAYELLKIVQDTRTASQ